MEILLVLLGIPAVYWIIVWLKDSNAIRIFLVIGLLTIPTGFLFICLILPIYIIFFFIYWIVKFFTR